MSIWRKIWDVIKKYALITAASMLYAVAFCWFYQPNGLSNGGFTGISQILNHIFPVLPIGVTTVVLNIPLFIIGTKKQGIKLLISSIYAMTVSSLLIDVVNMIYIFPKMDDLILAGLFGGLLTGVSAGLELKFGATTGGTELAAKLLKYKFHHISVGKLCLAVDVIIIIAYALVFRKVNNALYGIASMYVFSLAVDFVIYGGTHAKMAYIISEESGKIKEMLLSMNLGVTMVNSQGGWNGDDKQMVLCAFKRQQIAAIKKAVTDIDPKAFVIVCDAHEVLGEGFGSYSPDEL
ncbi:MAG TPA: YitT family protein [Ruminococcaceae bacterium]|nr:YitT family protein [Oscillospiraceae bacterium]